MNKKLGFGCMRLPMKNDKIDYEEFTKMVDMFMANGFTYFDTAHVYHGGNSEIALRDCLTSRYPRESYQLTNKLSGSCFKEEKDIRPLVDHLLEICGVEYFDYFLMHAQSRSNYEHFTKCRAYEISNELKKEGKIKHLGLSFHDDAAFLDQILNEHPEIEIVQIQFNYYDFNSSSVQSKLCYDVCKKHHLPIIVMEPIKGGKLANLPKEALDVLKNDENLSPASFAVRFVASFDDIVMVLSGMSNLEQLADNISYMKDFKPFTKEEYEKVNKVVEILDHIPLIECTACRYCIDGCPKQIHIPDLFHLYNETEKFAGSDNSFGYRMHTKNNNLASDCIKCGKCEKICPQHLPIRSLLENVAKRFEK